MAPLDTIMNGDLLKGLLEVFTNTSGDVVFFFLCIAGLSVLTFISTQSAAYGALVFVLFSGALVGSHLSQFSVNFGLIPSEFQGLVLLILVLGFMYVVYAAWTRRN